MSVARLMVAALTASAFAIVGGAGVPNTGKHG